MTTLPQGPGAGAVIGVDTGAGSLREADHDLHELVDALGGPVPGLIACTHLVRLPGRQVTVLSLALPDASTAERVRRDLPDLLAERYGPGAAASSGNPGYEHGPADAVRAAGFAAAEHARRSGGRAVVYPGVAALTGTLTVADLLSYSAIGATSVVGGPPADPAAPVETRGHVRPEWCRGVLTLALAPAPGGRLAPFEVPNPTPCCADHA
ncbi:hypothetical protein [Actinacidiphila acididurans]|uniref:Uncharacterized protein n=1 Tax=Actinacidiphila acididurans TaxID=2784346 RepID=A0ABS2TLT6_9ACTN|nr:hypothetical protein [Actinacidiphila acididurans]MBM9504303.1 hypothetical protein [Actinacidiphila acididurans]